jgi:hypothetical protein
VLQSWSLWLGGYPIWVTQLRSRHAKLAHCIRRKFSVASGDEELYRKTLRAAVDRKGGPQALAEALRVRRSVVYGWLSGVLLIPRTVFFQLVELLEEETRATNPQDRKAPRPAEPEA